MGTTCTHKPAGMPLEQFFIEHGVLRWGDDLPDSYRVLASAYKMPAFYAAIEQIHKETGERRVWAAVIKVGMYRGEENLCYKEMSEDVGPCYYDCPAKILDMLTPTDSEYANAWRAKCREKLARAAERKSRKIGPGTVLLYGDRRYEVTEVLPRGYMRVLDDYGVKWRMKPGQVRAATMESAS